MRIISGKYKGRIIKAPKKLPVRPTTGYAKESLFNIIQNYFDFSKVKVLELFSGTGNILYEFGSRGAEELTGVEKNRNCLQFIQKMNSELELNIKTVKSDAIRFLVSHGEQYDIIFADPPYGYRESEKIHQLVFENGLLKKNGWLILEHSKKESFKELKGFHEQRALGNVNFSIFTNESAE